MKQTYKLNEAQLPTMVTPHDCVIKEIKKDDDFLIFVFEDDISHHDSFEDKKTLKIKYHLIQEYEIYRQKWNRLMKRSEYTELKNESILFKGNSQYLYQCVGYEHLLIQLYKDTMYVLSLNTDYVEYEWVEK